MNMYTYISAYRSHMSTESNEKCPQFFPKMDIFRKTYHHMYVQSQSFIQNILMYHFHLKVLRQAHSEDCYSNYNETAYSEPFEMTKNYSSLQSWYSYADNGYDLNTYSYNHLHENTVIFTSDVYDVVEPMFPSPLQTNAQFYSLFII